MKVKRISKLRYFFYVAIFFLPVQNVSGVELVEIRPPNITPTLGDIQRGEILIDGEIQQGDLDKIIQYLKSRAAFPSGFSIRSSGGDIVEAEKIGSFFRDTLLSIYVMEYCYSACFIILAASSYRVVPDSAQVGIHTPQFYQENFKGLSPEESAKKYNQLKSESENYFKKFGVPVNIIEKMFSIPFGNLYILETREKQFLKSEPADVREWIRVKCNPLTTSEYNDLNKKKFIDRNLKPEEPPLGLSRDYWTYLVRKNDHAMECLGQIRKERLQALLEKYN